MGRVEEWKYGFAGVGVLASEGKKWYEKVKDFFTGVYHKVTEFHFENRDALNTFLPSYDKMMYMKKIGGNEWILLAPELSVLHDNGIGDSELKYIHPDGREVVYTRDFSSDGSYEIYTDPKYKGTYNYVVPGNKPDDILDVKGWIEFGGKGIGHVFADVIPYYLTGKKMNGRNKVKLSIVFVLLFFVILSYGCASYTYVTYKNQERNAFLQQTDSSPFQMFDVRGMYFFAYVSEMHYYEEHYYVAGIHIYPYPYPLDTFQVTVENLVISDSNGNKLFIMEESLLINHINSYVQSYDYTDINYDHGSVPFITKVPLEVFEEQHVKYFITFEVDGKHMCQTLVKDAKTFVYPTYKGRIIEGW